MLANITVSWDSIEVGETLLDSPKRYGLPLRVGMHYTNLNEDEKKQL